MIAIFQHVSYEGPGLIQDWLDENKLKYHMVQLYNNDKLPDLHELDGLIIMGGEMNVYEEKIHPWLKTEKEFIRKLIANGKKVFGVCLGAQMIASALGATIRRNPALEIGWYPVMIDTAQLPAVFKGVFPKQLKTFHWHGDMFEVPGGTVPFAFSEACSNQGFLLGNQVLGLQFHMEMKPSGIEDLFEHCSEDLLSESVFVQSAEDIREGLRNVPSNKKILNKLLSAFFEHGYE